MRRKFVIEFEDEPLMDDEITSDIVGMTQYLSDLLMDYPVARVIQQKLDYMLAHTPDSDNIYNEMIKHFDYELDIMKRLKYKVYIEDCNKGVVI